MRSTSNFARRSPALRRAAHAEAKAIVLTGTGKMFSAGVDLKRLSAGGAAYVRDFLPSLHRLYEAVFFHPKPVVAAINGHAIAGGCISRRAPTAGSWRAMSAASASPNCWSACLPGACVRNSAFCGPCARAGGGDVFRRDLCDRRRARARLDRQGRRACRIDAACARRGAGAGGDFAGGAFAQTKAQMRAPVAERFAISGAVTDKAVTDVWCAPRDARARARLCGADVEEEARVERSETRAAADPDFASLNPGY